MHDFIVASAGFIGAMIMIAFAMALGHAAKSDDDYVR
jgi:hypothetical protein